MTLNIETLQQRLKKKKKKTLLHCSRPMQKLLGGEKKYHSQKMVHRENTIQFTQNVTNEQSPEAVSKQNDPVCHSNNHSEHP